MEQELLYKYFKGTTSEEEERLILDWVDASPGPSEGGECLAGQRLLKPPKLGGWGVEQGALSGC